MAPLGPLPLIAPRLQLETLYVLDERGRIRGTREPGPSRGPAFALIRGPEAVAWALRADVPEHVAVELAARAGEERPSDDLTAEPRHAEAYRALSGGATFFGPAFAFPAELPAAEARELDDESLLAPLYSGWVEGEIEAGRAPLMAVLVDGAPVSICFSARRSAVAAEAGLETAAAHRGRGYAVQATAAWAGAVQARGLIPLYSTSWDNTSSLAVARKLGLIPYASDWSVGA